MLRRIFLFSVLSLIFIFFGAVPSFACEGGGDYVPTETFVEDAELIFVGTIIGGYSRHNDDTIMIAEVEVETYLKGEGSAVVEIDGFGYGEDCLSVVELGDHLIFFAQALPDGGLIAVYQNQHDAVRTASPENIAEIQAITNQAHSPSPLALDAQLGLFIKRYGQWLLGFGVVALGLGGIFYWFKSKPESEKIKSKRE